MTIELNQVGKRYRENWIFKNVTLNFQSGEIYALLGANGSGKSTLLRIIAGIQGESTGTIIHKNKNKIIAPELVFKQISFCAPGMDIVEEMTLKEFLNFHFSFKKLLPGISVPFILKEMDMKSVQNKFIHEFSSGMKQRVKLAQAFFADTELLLLDEPCSNLDLKGGELYQKWINNYANDRILIIASNDQREFEQAQHLISIENYKEWDN